MPGADDDDGDEHEVHAGEVCNRQEWESRWDYGSDKVEGHSPSIPDGNMEQCNPYYRAVPPILVAVNGDTLKLMSLTMWKMRRTK